MVVDVIDWLAVNPDETILTAPPETQHRPFGHVFPFGGHHGRFRHIVTFTDVRGYVKVTLSYTTEHREGRTEMNEELPLLLSIDQAVTASGLSRTVLYDRVMRGRIASVKEGRRRLIPRGAIEAYVARLLAEQGEPGA